MILLYFIYVLYLVLAAIVIYTLIRSILSLSVSSYTKPLRETQDSVTASACGNPGDVPLKCCDGQQRVGNSLLCPPGIVPTCLPDGSDPFKGGVNGQCKQGCCGNTCLSNGKYVCQSSPCKTPSTPSCCKLPGGCGSCTETLCPVTSSWVWSTDTVQEANSCTNPSTQNIGQKVGNDPTSIVLDATTGKTVGGIGCYLTNMSDCKFNLHDIKQIEFDITVSNCEDTWFSFWASPVNYGNDNTVSGEIDFIEACPINGVYSNWAGASDNIASPTQLSSNTSNFTAALKITISPNGLVEVYKDTVKTSSKYSNIFNSHGCTQYNSSDNCVFMFKADIWNGTKGDSGYDYCMQNRRGSPINSKCKFAITNLRLTPFKSEYKFPVSKCNALLI